MSELKNALENEFMNEMEELKKAPLGSSEQKVQTDCALAIADRIIELDARERADYEKDRDYQLMIDRDNISKSQIYAQKKNDAWQHVLNVAGIIVPAMVSIGGVILSLKVEFGDYRLVTSSAGKEFIKKLFNFRKG